MLGEHDDRYLYCCLAAQTQRVRTHSRDVSHGSAQNTQEGRSFAVYQGNLTRRSTMTCIVCPITIDWSFHTETLVPKKWQRVTSQQEHASSCFPTLRQMTAWSYLDIQSWGRRHREIYPVGAIHKGCRRDHSDVAPSTTNTTRVNGRVARDCEVPRAGRHQRPPA